MARLQTMPSRGSVRWAASPRGGGKAQPRPSGAAKNRGVARVHSPRPKGQGFVNPRPKKAGSSARGSGGQAFSRVAGQNAFTNPGPKGGRTKAPLRFSGRGGAHVQHAADVASAQLK